MRAEITSILVIDTDPANLSYSIIVRLYLAIPHITPRLGCFFARRLALVHCLGFASGERLLGHVRVSARRAHTDEAVGAHRLPGLRETCPMLWMLLCHFVR